MRCKTFTLFALFALIALVAAGCESTEVQLPASSNGDADGGPTDQPPDDPPDDTPKVTCGPGTKLNSAGTECVIENEEDADQIVTCPPGQIPAEDASSSKLVCVEVTPVTVHGFVWNIDTGESLPGVTVSLYPKPIGEDAGDTVEVTDDSGYFEFVDVGYGGTMTATYKLDGYVDAHQALDVPLVYGDGSKILVVNGSIFLSPTPEDVVVPDPDCTSDDDCPEGELCNENQECEEEETVIVDPPPGPGDPPVGDKTVAGTVYAGDGPAVGVVVSLRDNTDITDVAETTTGADGSFVLDKIYDPGDHTFTLRVDAYDADGDGGDDYQYQEVFLGGLDDVDPSLGINYTNIVVVMETTQKFLVYSNLTPALPQLSGPVAPMSGYYLSSASSNVIFHFGAETDQSTLQVALYEYYELGVTSSYGTEIAVDAQWNASGTQLILDPQQSLDVDTNPGTQYEIRISGLLWADGSAFIPLNVGQEGALKIRFDIGSEPTYLPNPQPNLYVSNLGDEDQTVTSVSCDSRVCWLMDSSGYPLNGYADTTSLSQEDAFFNAASGVQLSWTAVTGAVAYNVYARQSYTGSAGEQLFGWQQIDANIDLGLGGLTGGGTVTATGVLASGYPSWSDFGVGALGGPVGNPLAYGNILELAVTSVSGDGYESPIDESKTRVLLDVTKSRLVQVSEIQGQDGDLNEETETGSFAVEKSFRVRFSELMSTQASGSWEVRSGNITSFQTNGVTTDWDDDGGVVPDSGVFASFELDFAGVCTPLTQDVNKENDSIFVQDITPFQKDFSVFFVTSDGHSLAHTATRVVDQTIPLEKTVRFTAPLDNEGSGDMAAGTFACRVEASDGLSSALYFPIGSGSSTIDVADPNPFYPNQEILVFSDVPSLNVHRAKVLQVREGKVGINGITIVPGALDVEPAVPFNADGGNVMAAPGDFEEGFRHARDLGCTETFITDSTDQLQVHQDLMKASTVKEGDLLLVDADGNLDTVSDRAFTRVSTIHMDPNPAGGVEGVDYHVSIEPAPGGDPFYPLPQGLFLQEGVTRVIHLGDSFSLTGYADTSGNAGLSNPGSSFSFCNVGDLDACQNGIFLY